MCKSIILPFVLAALLSACSDQASSSTEVKPLVFDEQLAKEVGADDYGMRKYVMAFLKSGPNRDRPKAEADALQEAHMKNINKLAESGMLCLAGPFMHDGELRGIYVFNVETVEEAEKLTNTDPAIQAGSLVMELVPWYGSAALMKINELHTQVAKINI